MNFVPQAETPAARALNIRLTQPEDSNRASPESGPQQATQQAADSKQSSMSASEVLEPTQNNSSKKPANPHTSASQLKAASDGVDRLNLTRPQDWEDLVKHVPIDITQPFSPKFRQALAAVEQNKAVRRLLAARKRKREGMPADEYNWVRADGSMPVKLANGSCGEFREDAFGVVRFYVTLYLGRLGEAHPTCYDGHANPLLQKALEYDAVGRAIPSSAVD